MPNAGSSDPILVNSGMRGDGGPNVAPAVLSSAGSATEHPVQTMSLEDAITKLRGASLDDRGNEILAGAERLLNSAGRAKKTALHSLCAQWPVQRQERNEEGKWRNRDLSTLERELKECICLAAAR